MNTEPRGTVHYSPDEAERAAIAALHAARQAERELEPRPFRMTRLELLVAVLVGALLAAAIFLASRPVDASAADGSTLAVVEAGDLLERAAGYHGERVADGVDLRVIYDPAGIERARISLGMEPGRAPIAFVLKYAGEERARGPIYVGDVYLAGALDYQCEVIAHEYGHLLGLADGVHYERDPLFVMGSDPRTPQCAELAGLPGFNGITPVYVPAPPDAAALELAETATATAERDELLTIRWEARQRRHDCMERAGDRRTRKQRERARARCRAAYSRAVR